MLEKMQLLCSKSEHCVSDIEAKLYAYKLPKQQIESIISSLVEEGYIDEERYARAYVRDKYRFNSWGRVKIRAMLRSKGIANCLIDNAMEAIDEEEYLSLLSDLIEKKRRTLSKTIDDEYLLRQKLISHAAQHGYEPNEIFKLL